MVADTPTYRDGVEEERQQLELTNPTPSTRPTATVTDIIEDIVYSERTIKFGIPRTLQEDSNNGNTKWWDVYTRAFGKAFKRDAASWAGTNRVENIDPDNFTSRSDSSHPDAGWAACNSPT